MAVVSCTVPARSTTPELLRSEVRYKDSGSTEDLGERVLRDAYQIKVDKAPENCGTELPAFG